MTGLFVNHSTIEEPYEVKVSRPVLKTSRRGDLTAEFNFCTLRALILQEAQQCWGFFGGGREALPLVLANDRL